MDNLSDQIILIVMASVFLLIVAVGIVLLVFIYQKKQILYVREKEQLKSDFEKQLLESKLEIQEQTFRNISQEIQDRKSTRLNSSHSQISYAVHRLTKKNLSAAAGPNHLCQPTQHGN